MVGGEAEFRPGQLEAVTALYAERRRVLVVQRTGWGKSAVYFIATRLLRDDGRGPTLLVSPLLALMRNQIDMADAHRRPRRDDQLGQRGRLGADQGRHPREPRSTCCSSRRSGSTTASSATRCCPRSSPPPGSWSSTRRTASATGATTSARTTGASPVSSTRCRPGSRCSAPPPRPTTAWSTTSSRSSAADIAVHRGTLDRESLVAPAGSDMPRRPSAWRGSSRRSRRSREPASSTASPSPTPIRVADWLETNGINAHAYSGDTDPEIREQVERDLLDNRVKVVVATSALGMGFDKPDLAFVIHFQSPGLGHRVLPAGRPGRPSARTLRRDPAAGRRGRARSRTGSSRPRSRRKPKAEQVIALLEEAGRPLSTSVAHGRGQRSEVPTRGHAEDPRGRRRRGARRHRLAADRASRGPTTRSGSNASPQPGGPNRRRCGRTAGRRAA